MQNPYLTLLKNNRNFRLLASALAVSLMGDWFSLIAVFTLLGHAEGAGAAALGVVLVIKHLPMLLVSPLAGVVADRFDRCSIMINSDLLRAICVLALLLTPQHGQLWIVYLLLICQSSFSAFFEPARSALTPDIMEARDLVTANAITSMIWSSSLIIGSALGGVVTEVFGWETAIVIDAASYLVSAWFIRRVRTEATQSSKHGASSLGLRVMLAYGGGDLKEFVAYVRGDAQIRALSMIKGIYGIGGAMVLLVTLYGQRVYEMGESGALGISILYFARGLGALSGPFLFRAICRNEEARMRRAIYFALVTISICYMLVGVSPGLLSAAVFVYGAHMMGSVIWVFSTVLLQLSVKGDLRGRVFSFDLGFNTLTFCLSTLFYGYLIDSGVFDVRRATVLLGASWLAAALWWRRRLPLWHDTFTSKGV